MKAGDQIVVYQSDLARHCESGVVFVCKVGTRGEVVDMHPPLYSGTARVKFFDSEGEFYINYEAIALARGYVSGDTRRADDNQPASS